MFENLIIMKNILSFFLIVLSLLLASCSTSTDVSSTDDNGPATLFFPLTNANWWTYKVQTQAPLFTRDSLYVKSDTVIGGLAYKKLKTKFAPNGFFSSTMNNNGIRIEGSKLKLSGSIEVAAGLPSPILFSVADFIIFKENANPNDVLSSTSGSFQQTVQGYPLTFSYTLSSYCDGSLANFTTTTNKTYVDLKKSKIVLNLKITYTIPGLGLSATLLQPQDVIVSTQYYARNKGMVYANTDINYTLTTVPNLTLPIPSTGNQNQKEFLDTFQIN